MSRPRKSSRKSANRDRVGGKASGKRYENDRRKQNSQNYGSNCDFWGGRKNDSWDDASNADASGFANFNDLGWARSRGRGRSKGTKLSKRLPFGEALEQSTRRSINHDKKRAQSSSSFDVDHELDTEASQKFGKIGKFTITNDGGDSSGADTAIIEFNNKLRSEVADLEKKCSQEAAKNVANETRIREMAAMEKVLREENLKLRSDLASSEANVIALERRFENSKNVKYQAPWKQAACMILDNFRAAASITEDALVRMGGSLDRGDEFSKVVEPRTPKKLIFGYNESIELDVISNSLATFKKRRSDSGDDVEK